jgi:alpha-galactosidase
MTKIAIIGAGSGFGGRISADILTRFQQEEIHIALCDINKDKLDIVEKYVNKVIELNKLPARVSATTERREAIKNADFVLISVSIGGPAYYDEPFESELSIPSKYGITQTVADTLGPGALFRALRTAPEMIRMVQDINELAPGSVILNLVNPMAVLTTVLTQYAKVPLIGLCHGAIGNAKQLAKIVDVPFHEVDYTVAGINHMTWFIKFMHNGKDLLPRIKEEITGRHRQKFEFRSEIMEHIGYFTTESDRHIVEYVPWFQHVDKSVLQPYVDITRNVKNKRHHWYEDMGITIDKADSFELILSNESASGIMEGLVKGKPFVFSGNVINKGYISNLPDGVCVEVPCTADRNGIHPHTVGKLPTVCAALNMTNINEQQLVVEAILEKNREKAFQALLLDPETQTKLTMQQTKQLFEEMWNREIELGMELF